MRALNQKEEQTLAEVVSRVGDAALLLPTATGLQKSIMDATLPIRTLLTNSGIHDFSAQKQGPAHKIVGACTLLTDTGTVSLRVSLYRPITKDGDPRIWISKLPEYAKADDILALFVFDSRLHVLNVSRTELVSDAEKHRLSPLLEYLSAVERSRSTVAVELLNKLRRIAARGAIAAVCHGDTAIGRTLETLLDIKQNPRKTPDYKGIELKSYRDQVRSGSETRATLFAQVPNWSISALKSSSEILDTFGYARDGAFKLYCQVSTRVPNSQGLRFRIDGKADRLIEFSSRGKYVGDVAAWEFEKLHSRLMEKHRETFWIRAESVRAGARESFLYRAVQHTSKPSAAQFDQLVADGTISMDHLIKRLDSRVTEKGPLFKIEKRALSILFPHPRYYDLAD